MAIKQETHDIWGTQLYWGIIRLRKRTELYHVHPTFEIDNKLRWGLSHIFRFPLTSFGVYFGRWQSTRSGSEEEAILKALSGRVVEDSEEQEQVKQKARETVAANSNSLDDEWKLVNMLDLV